MPDKVEFTVGGTPLRFERKGSRILAPHERTLECLEDGMSWGAWLDASELKKRTFNDHLAKLRDAGLIVARNGCYERAPSMIGAAPRLHLSAPVAPYPVRRVGRRARICPPKCAHLQDFLG